MFQLPLSTRSGHRSPSLAQTHTNIKMATTVPDIARARRDLHYVKTPPQFPPLFTLPSPAECGNFPPPPWRVIKYREVGHDHHQTCFYFFFRRYDVIIFIPETASSSSSRFSTFKYSPSPSQPPPPNSSSMFKSSLHVAWRGHDGDGKCK